MGDLVGEGGQPVGLLLRQWRHRRRLSQLALAIEAEVSARHLSFVETGRSTPSRELLLRLAEQLDVPLRERNTLLLAAGYAPVYSHAPLGSPELSRVLDAVHRVLRAHEPYPAVAVDRRWDLVAGNAALALLIDGAAASLLRPPVNALRLTLHPDGVAPRIANLGQWRAHLLARLRRQAALTGDAALATLHEELLGYPGPPAPGPPPGPADVVVPLRLRHDGGELRLLSTVSTFGTPLDVTVEELSVESFFPADDATAARLRDAAG
ncbi:helix-turn-helix transcriptional regulator [Micromonospora purpureochromogenes]|uniref:helix-turn-helix domain-containing protein n=1 Tax=Micromonospora purpureochromogenes TaxID=47872 RepID=UPI0033C30565